MLDWVGSLNIIRTSWRHQPDVWETRNVPVMCRCHATQLSNKYLLQKSSISDKAELAQSQVIHLITLGLQTSQNSSWLHRKVSEQPDGLGCALVIILMVILTSKQNLISVLWKSQAQEKARGLDATSPPSQPDSDAAFFCPPWQSSSHCRHCSQFRSEIVYNPSRPASVLVSMCMCLRDWKQTFDQPLQPKQRLDCKMEKPHWAMLSRTSRFSLQIAVSAPQAHLNSSGPPLVDQSPH